MSLPNMRAGPSASLRLAPGRVGLAVLVVAGLLSACGRATDEARAAAGRALDEVDGLRGRVAELEVALERASSDLHDARASEDRVEKALRSLGDRLERSLARLKASLSEVRAASTEQAAAAVSQAQGAARDLEILEERFNYHLRQGGR